MMIVVKRPVRKLNIFRIIFQHHPETLFQNPFKIVKHFLGYKAMDAMDDDSCEKTCSKTKHIPYHISAPSRNSLSESLYFCFQSVLLGIWGEPKKIWLPDGRAPESYDFICHFLLASKPPNSKGLEWYPWKGLQCPNDPV